MTTPRLHLTDHPAAAAAVAALRDAVEAVDAAPDGRVLAADQADAARAALARGEAVLLAGRPHDLDGLRALGGLLVVADPPWLLVSPAAGPARALVIDGWPAAAWAFLGALAGRAVPGESTPPRADGATLHPTVAVDGPVELGPGTRVWHFSKLLGPCTIGAGCSLGQNVVVERHVQIGDNVRIQNNVSVYSGVILEDDVFCGPSMVFTNVGTPRSHFPRKGSYQTTRVGRGASIGANATVVCGVRLGPYAFVGAGAVVTRDVPAHGLVYGNPARLRGWACYCGVRLPLGVEPDGEEHGACEACGRRYRRRGLSIEEER